MDTKLLKTVIIIILACVNLAFGGILVFDRISGAGAAAKERDELAAVIQSRGIDISSGIIPTDESVTVYSIVRDLGQELAIASALLGNVEPQPQGGNIYFYENSSGYIRFRAGGGFEAAIYNCGLTDDEIADCFGARRSGGEYVFFYDGNAIFNCTIQIKRSGAGVMLSGTHPLGTPGSWEEREGPGISTVLLRFVEEMVDSGIVCTKIASMTPGYLMTVAAAEAKLEPVWSVNTDAGVYFVYAESGKTVLQ